MFRIHNSYINENIIMCKYNLTATCFGICLLAPHFQVNQISLKVVA
jgi:hypothetical protein